MEKEKELKQQVKEKKDERSGISELVNSEGKTVITVDLFTETYDLKYNGVYIIDRIEVRHQDMWASLANISKNSSSLETSIEESAQEIVKNRKGQNIQVKHVMAMIKNGGVDPEGKFSELTDEEKISLNVKASKGIDMKDVYSSMTTVLDRLIIQYPENLTLDNEEDWGHFHPGLGKELFDRCMALLMSRFSIDNGLKKK